jgi:hypothetical protein
MGEVYLKVTVMLSAEGYRCHLRSVEGKRVAAAAAAVVVVVQAVTVMEVAVSMLVV